MPRKNLVARSFVELTENDTALITVENQSQQMVWLFGMSDENSPNAASPNAVPLNPGEVVESAPLQQLFPDIVGVKRVWAWTDGVGHVLVRIPVQAGVDEGVAVTRIISMSQAAYDTLATKDPHTLYCITE